MSRRGAWWTAIAVAAAGAVGVAAARWSGDSRPRPRAAPDGGAGLPVPAAAAPRARLRPAPLPVPAAEGTLEPADERPLWDAREAESRDPAWADAKERAIGERVRALVAAATRDRPGGVAVPQIECRETHCRLLVTGTDGPAFRAFVESLQDERGFYGDADLLALDGYSEVPDGSGGTRYSVRVHLQYRR
ncbi:MAG: hypothetical protein D6689_01675 [Deltaproteobacteria bacterium]|nr:MAG: hypothetical protein D6689_01675 [Deltaproteobacteria bacterium]